MFRIGGNTGIRTCAGRRAGVCSVRPPPDGMREMTASPSTATGACLCGRVCFALDWPSLWVAHCHCTQCRRGHGAAYVTWLGMAESRARIVDAGDGHGASALRWHASSPGAERGFCARCGSPLFFRSARWPGELHIALGSLDGEADRAPEAHVFWDTHVDWCSVDPDDGLPRRTASEID